MGSSGKKRTTMAKLNRESKLRDKRADKEARKNARRLTAANGGPALESGSEEFDATSFDSGDDTHEAESSDDAPEIHAEVSAFSPEDGVPGPV